MTILAAVDLYAISWAPLEHAAWLSRELRTPLRLLHVMQAPLFFAPESVVATPRRVYRSIYDDACSDMDRLIENLAERTTTSGSQPADEAPPAMVGRIKIGNAAAEILAYANECQARFIVMGTHGRTGFSRLVHGSVAEEVVRRAACPVLVVPDVRLDDVAAAGVESSSRPLQSGIDAG